ncbi:MAG: hypothetical protein ACTSQ8_24130 [Candidatus Helarchaeota archaeon]
MKEKFLKAAKERLAYLKEWLRRFIRTQEHVPQIQNLVERTEWEIKMLTDLPEGGEEFIPPGIIGSYGVGNDFIEENFPLPPKYYLEATNSTASISVASSTDLYSVVSRVGEIKANEFQVFSGLHTSIYRDMQEKQTRFEKINNHLQQLNSDRIDEFISAREAYLAMKADVGNREAAGIAMRNVLEHFKGDLFELARKHEKENMTWDQMSKRLAKNGVGSIEHSELLRQKQKWGSLHIRLSEVAKGQKNGLVADLDDIYTMLLDHMFTILGVINLK